MPNFEYFCGANVVVSIEGVPTLEAAGLSYEVTDSRMPIYGYSSRHYDAIAEGQVLVQGILLVNYIYQDYIYRIIQRGVMGRKPESSQADNNIDPPPELNVSTAQNVLQNQEIIEAAVEYWKRQFWTNKVESISNATYGSTLIDSVNPNDIYGGVSIIVSFGVQGPEAPYGRTSFLIQDVHFRGRSSRIQIDEETIVEAFPFFARDVYSLRNPKITSGPQVIAVSNEATIENA